MWTLGHYCFRRVRKPSSITNFRHCPVISPTVSPSFTLTMPTRAFKNINPVVTLQDRYATSTDISLMRWESNMSKKNWFRGCNRQRSRTELTTCAWNTANQDRWTRYVYRWLFQWGCLYPDEDYRSRKEREDAGDVGGNLQYVLQSP